MTSTLVKLSAAMEKSLRYWADTDAAPCYLGGNASTRAALITRGLLAVTNGHGITAAGREWLAAKDASTTVEPVAEQPEPAVHADPEVLMSAIACMANRMATSTQQAGAAAATGRDYRKHLDACTRQRNAMHRLMDALAKLQGATYAPSWRFRHTLMSIAQAKRDIAKGN